MVQTCWVSLQYTVKKRLAILVSDIRAGDGKMANLFLQCICQTQGDFSNNMDHLSILVCTKVLLKQESTMKNGISTEINFRSETVINPFIRRGAVQVVS